MREWLEGVGGWFLEDLPNRGLAALLALTAVAGLLSYLQGLLMSARGFCGARNRRGDRCRNYVADGARCRVRHGGSWFVLELIVNAVLIGVAFWALIASPVPADWLPYPR